MFFPVALGFPGGRGVGCSVHEGPGGDPHLGGLVVEKTLVLRIRLSTVRRTVLAPVMTSVQFLLVPHILHEFTLVLNVGQLIVLE